MGTESLLPCLPSPRSTQQNGGPGDWAESRGTFICKNCSQMFYTEKGLGSHMCFHSDQWPSPRTKQEQVKGRTQQALCLQGFRRLRGAIYLRIEKFSTLCGELGGASGDGGRNVRLEPPFRSCPPFLLLSAFRCLAQSFASH